MASSKALIISLFLWLSILVLVLQADGAEESLKIGNSQVSPNSLLQDADIDCESACDARCSKTKRLKICKRACGTCCARCHCVPPGTSGNEDVCPCYANMTTHGGKHKCP